MRVSGWINSRARNLAPTSGVSRRRSFGRRGAGVLVLVLLASIVPTASPALAADEDGEAFNPVFARETAVNWAMGSLPSVARASAEALLGTDDQVVAFIEEGSIAPFEADQRAAAQTLASTDGPAMRSAALKALEGSTEDLTAFVDGGWQLAWTADERVRAYRELASGGPVTRAAAEKALAGTDDDVSEFLLTGRRESAYADDRLAVTRMLTTGPNNSGPVMDASAQAALKGDEADVREFVLSGQYVARARDKELASIGGLLQQAKEAGATTSREALSAQKASDTAVGQAQEAKKAAQEARDESKAAGGSAKKASAAAGRAADAAEAAADAARDATSASNAAMRAARVAADAARKATTAAALTAQAAARAQQAAAAARTDASKASAARQAAEAARDAAKKARALGEVRAERDRALAQAGQAAEAARSASSNADAAADAAGEAGAQAGVSAEQAQRARDAAARTKRLAAAAARAADRALALANKAAKASDAAFKFAEQAAGHAEKAAAAADDAADHAGNAATAAAESTKHANAAVTAADLATEAAAQAVELETLAREEDEERLTEATEQGVLAAQEALATEQSEFVAEGEQVAWNRKLTWDTAEIDRIEAPTKQLLTEATAAGAAEDVVVNRGRRAALALLKTGGEWTQTAARDALNTDEALHAWLSEGRVAAAGQDDRARVWKLIDSLPVGAEKTAAESSLNGDDATVQQFLRTRDYPGKVGIDRRAIYKILATAGPSLKTASERALSGTPADAHAFLRTGQHTARAADERLEVYRVMEVGGPEVDAAASVALAGPTSGISYFLSTDRYKAAQRDLEQTSHVSTVRGLILQALQYAETARSDASEAQRVAAVARKASAEATKYAQQAADSATKAAKYAEQASDSAVAAQKSANEAAQSAETARKAANTAQEAANAAAKSATEATGASNRAAVDAADARQYADDARASATAAGADAEAAQAAADEASVIYAQKLRAWQEERRSQEANSASDGQGTALDEMLTWECMDVADNLSKECAKVYLSFADTLMHPARCASPANADSAGCIMFGDVKGFIDENPDLLVNMLQLTLMTCGLVPGFGEACDAIDAGVSAANGDWVGAALSLGSAVPFLGWAGTAGNAYRRGDKLREARSVFKKLGDRCKASSFEPGTPVLMADGSQKPIEQIRIGELVRSTDPRDGRTAAKAVLATITSVGLKHIVDVTVDTDGDQGSATATVAATDNHPFWESTTRDWREAGTLRPGLSLQNQDAAPVTIEKVGQRDEQERVYNLSVFDLNTYYVVAGNQTLLVHNCGSLGDSGNADINGLHPNGVGGAHAKNHLDKSDADIQERAVKEGRPASTLKTAGAQELIDIVIAEKADQITKWMAKNGGPTELAISKKFPNVVGRVAHPGADAKDGQTLTVVLKKYKAPAGKPKHKPGYVLYTVKVS